MIAHDIVKIALVLPMNLKTGGKNVKDIRVKKISTLFLILTIFLLATTQCIYASDYEQKGQLVSAKWEGGKFEVKLLIKQSDGSTTEWSRSFDEVDEQAESDLISWNEDVEQGKTIYVDIKYISVDGKLRLTHASKTTAKDLSRCLYPEEHQSYHIQDNTKV